MIPALTRLDVDLDEVPDLSEEIRRHIQAKIEAEMMGREIGLLRGITSAATGKAPTAGELMAEITRAMKDVRAVPPAEDLIVTLDLPDERVVYDVPAMGMLGPANGLRIMSREAAVACHRACPLVLVEVIGERTGRYRIATPFDLPGPLHLPPFVLDPEPETAGLPE